MNTVFNRVYWMAIAGVVLIAATLLSGAALSEADEARAAKAGKVVRVPAHQLPKFDPQRIEVATHGDTLHVQLQPGAERMNVTVVDSAIAGNPKQVVIEHADRKGKVAARHDGSAKARPANLE